MTNTWLKRRVYLQWAALLALVPLFLTSSPATGGPGADTAASDAKLEGQCSLPPFLNVAVSERPNIMVLYDNSSSMSLQGYSKAYDPTVHYYGLFNADSCYSYASGNPGEYTKAPIYPEEVIDPAVGSAYKNPAIDYKNLATVDEDIRVQHYDNRHFCTDPNYPWSGNFMNWFTMRRVDLLRKAFTGGLSGGGNGNRSAVALEGESAFAPCFNKSYIVPDTYGTLAQPFYVVDPKFGQIVYGKSVDGDIVLGYSCPSGTEVISQRKHEAPEMLASAPSRFGSLAALVKSKLAAMTAWVQSRGTQVASLQPVMTAAGQSILAAPAAPDLQLVSWTITDAGGTPITSAFPGQDVIVSAVVSNISTNKDFAGDAGGLSVVIGAGPGSSAGDAPIGQCDLPAIAKSTTVTLTCNLTVPAAYLPTAFPAPNARLGVYVNYDNSPNESTVNNNWSAIAFFLVAEKPDLRLSSLTLSQSGGDITADFTLINDGVATGTFDIYAVWSVNGVFGDGDDDPEATCVAGAKSEQGAQDAHSCTVALPGWCADDCTLFIVVDPKMLTAPAESNTANNSASATYFKPDPSSWELGLTNVNVPAGVSAGGNLTVTYTITNSGGKDSDVPKVILEIKDAGGAVIASSVCAEAAAIPGGSSVATSCTVTIPPGTTADTYTVSLDLEPDDAVVANNLFTGSTVVTALVAACAVEKDCAYDITVNFFGRRRAGILWTFNRKELPAGQVAPANLGLTKFTDWQPATAGRCGGATTAYGGACTGNEFDGIQEGQSMSNSVVSHLEQASADMPKAPLASMLLNVVKYYQQRSGESTHKKASDEDPFLYDVDPLKNGTPHNCRRNYVLMITDGLSYGDNENLFTRADAPAHNGATNLRYYAQHLSNPAEQPTPVAMTDNVFYSVTNVPDTAMKPVPGTNGSYHLDNVALYANLQRGLNASGTMVNGVDLRADIAGFNTVQTVVVHTFSDGGTSTTNFDRSKRLLERTAVNGSYIERDGQLGVTSQQEWDADFNGIPDSYFQAKEGDDIGEVILNALNSILLKTASGTSVSVIASTARGEGAIYQSYFRPTTADAGREINWIGFLQAIWVDKYNNLREDTNNDGKLVLTEDRVLETVFNEFSKETFAYFYTTNANGERNGPYDGPYSLSEVTPIFESGRVLHNSEAKDRKIYTWGHWPTDAVPSAWPLALTDSEVSNCGGSGSCLMKHMWPGDNTYYNDAAMTTNLLRWVRGDDMADDTFRKRSMTIDGITNTWKLGDIVYSTPTVVGAPEERYDLLYGDRQEGYSEFFKAMARRKRMVYVGANDGMLHAFLGGVFRDGDDPGTAAREAAWYQLDPGEKLGQEMWSYVPGSLLPNLRVLADAGYDATCHVYYVDLKPKVTDVQIFFDASGDPIDNDVYPNGWGTILIGGMRLGCGKTQYSSYFILDISRPELPYLLAEFGDQSQTSAGTIQPAGLTNLDGLDFSFFYPVVLRVDDTSLSRNTNDGISHTKAGRWFMVVGSGPDQVQHTSIKPKSYVYAFDLTKLGARTGGKDGAPVPQSLESFTYAFDKFGDGTPLPAYAVVSNGLTADLDADFSVDTAYLVNQVDTGFLLGDDQWTGGIWRLNTNENPDPTTWKITNFFKTNDGTRLQPVVGAPGITRDPYGNIWVYFGTGRFIYNDKEGRIYDSKYGTSSSLYQQALYGVIDPCWDPSLPCTAVLPFSRTNLVRTDGFRLTLSPTKIDRITCAGTCPKLPPCAFCRLDDLINYIRTAPNYGWYRDMPDGPLTGGTTWEMSYNKPAVAGQLVLFTTYMPSIDAASCTIGGLSNLYVLNYQTGTAAKEDPFGNFDTTSTMTQEIKAEKRGFGKEPPSPPSIFGKQIFVQGSNAKITGIKTEAQFKLKPRIRGMVED